MEARGAEERGCEAAAAGIPGGGKTRELRGIEEEESRARMRMRIRIGASGKEKEKGVGETMSTTPRKDDGSQSNLQSADFADFLNSLKKNKMEIDAASNSSTNCIFFDRHSLPVPPFGALHVPAIATEAAFSGKETARNSLPFNRDALSAELYMDSIGILGGAGNRSKAVVELSSSSCGVPTHSNQVNQSLSRTSSLQSSRVRGSSSKKKDIHSVINNNNISSFKNTMSTLSQMYLGKRGEKMVVEGSFESLLVDEDVDGENNEAKN